MIEETEFSRPLGVGSLPREGLGRRIAADAEERAALARRFGLVDIAELGAEFSIVPAGRNVRVTGRVRADVTQTCVITLEPIPAHVEEAVDVLFAPAPRDRADRIAHAEETLTLDGEDEPDPIVDGRIDLGALAAEFVALGLDPYPRREGAEFSAAEAEDDEETSFSALARLDIVKPAKS